jgi:hypothetical protein
MGDSASSGATRLGGKKLATFYVAFSTPTLTPSSLPSLVFSIPKVPETNLC